MIVATAAFSSAPIRRRAIAAVPARSGSSSVSNSRSLGAAAFAAGPIWPSAKTAGSGLYAMSKFAALALAHAIRHAGWEEGVRSTALCPGLVATDMARGLTSLPPEAMTQPEDLARIVALLLELPNTASVAEIPVNALLEEAY